MNPFLYAKKVRVVPDPPLRSGHRECRECPALVVLLLYLMLARVLQREIMSPFDHMKLVDLKSDA